jgi:hypothetical protein
MPRLLLILAATAVLAGCETMPGFNSYKMWTESASDADLGLVQLSYEYKKWENPQPDERAAASMAHERCADWGFRDAVRKGEDRQCLEGTNDDCGRWQVTREYQCLKEKAK